MLKIRVCDCGSGLSCRAHPLLTDAYKHQGVVKQGCVCVACKKEKDGIVWGGLIKSLAKMLDEEGYSGKMQLKRNGIPVTEDVGVVARTGEVETC
jgi:hypothetical protein